MRALIQSDLTEPPRSVCVGFLPGTTPKQERHGHIFQCRELRQQIMELPNKTDFAVTKLGRSVLRKRSQMQVGEVYVTCRSSIKSADNVKQGTLAGTRLADDGQHFSLSHLER